MTRNGESRATKVENERSAPTDDNHHYIIHLQIIYYYFVARIKFERTIFLIDFFSLFCFQTWFFTDTDDENFQQRLNGHLINTKCPKGHSRRALSCKMAAELNTFLEHQKKYVSNSIVYPINLRSTEWCASVRMCMRHCRMHYDLIFNKS